MKRLLLSSLLVSCGSGCAAQLAPGVAVARGERAATVTAAGTLQAFRSSNSVLGLRGSAAVQDGLMLRSATLHGGYDWLVSPGHFTLEPGFDLGVGQPTVKLFDGVGAYWGVSGTARLRLYPWGDEPAYNLAAFPIFELVLWPQVGLWSPPQSADSHAFIWEGGASLGLRVALGSDVVTTGQGQVWDGGPDCVNDPHSDKSCSEPKR